jgi:LPS export ABC transporter protein LptC
MQQDYSKMLFCALLLGLCRLWRHEKRIKQPVTYKGPLREVRTPEMLFSDSARLKMHLKAPLQLEQTNGDQHFPKGVYIEFYNEAGVKSTTLKANKGIRYASTNLYNVRGNVIVRNLEKGRNAQHGGLTWKPETKRIFTEKFVTITTAEEILKGEGLDAMQDMTRYRIRKPTGVFPLKQTTANETN